MKIAITAALAFSSMTGLIWAQPERGIVPEKEPTGPRNGISISYELEDFVNDDTESWQFGYLEYKRSIEKFGSLIFRVDRADRFGKDGIQYEIDAYPKIADGLYAYINVGTSSDSLFPDHRFGAQLYKSLGNGWEASLGMRYLKFAKGTEIYTGSIGRYYGNWFTFLTPYVVPKDSGGASKSAAIESRLYGGTADSYWIFRGSFGNAPDVDTLLGELDDLQNWSVGIGRQLVIGKDRMLKLRAKYTDREFSRVVNRESVSASMTLKFRY